MNNFPLPSGLGVKEPEHTSTSAKVQILFCRTKSGGNGEEVGSCPPLTDGILTN